MSKDKTPTITKEVGLGSVSHNSSILTEKANDKSIRLLAYVPMEIKVEPSHKNLYCYMLEVLMANHELNTPFSRVKKWTLSKG